MEDINKIKKALYKEKSIAVETVDTDDYKLYKTQLSNGDVIEFKVPYADMGDAEFGNIMESQLLIRYIEI